METYGTEAVLEGVGWLRVKERLTIREILGIGSDLELRRDSKQLYLYWRTEADTLDDAIEQARRILRIAAAATGVVCPRQSLFTVREIAQ